jgi:hypothetical protein
MLPVSDSDGEGLTTFTAGHHHTLKVFEDGVEAFTTAAPILNGVDEHRVEGFLLILTPPLFAELAVHLHHGGLELWQRRWWWLAGPCGERGWESDPSPLKTQGEEERADPSHHRRWPPTHHD